jgi:uncharacterized membrane protein YdbT with pleckstrin-like domain
MQPDYDASPAMFRNNPLGFVAAVILIAAFGLGLLILLYWYIKARSVRLTVTGDTMHLTRGILSKDQTDLDVKDISTIRVFQSFWQRVFGVGRVEIFTRGDQPEMVLDGMPDPGFLRDHVRARGRLAEER